MMRTEQEVTQEIDDTKLKLERLLRERRGMMILQVRDALGLTWESWGWCIGCGAVQVCCNDGVDTCPGCVGGA